MATKLIEVNIVLKRVPRPRRFKVQRRVDIFARDRSNKRFLFATTWHTVKEVDRQVTAEKVCGHTRREDPKHEFRIAEEWPIGSNLREIK